ncbi:MAG: hypothetical protein KatS3mg027_2513 [Bacteroidia bacterium]|nr:MAG: hypothetical protein KatS3mg027_2513 [Bacteroidia bacterium]
MGRNNVVIGSLIIALVMFYFNITQAQDSTRYWKSSGFLGLNYSQTALSNWQGGGQNNIAVNSILNFNIEYTKGIINWTNKLDAQYGLNRPGFDKLFKKNLDQILFVSKFNTKTHINHFFYSAMLDFRTQFAPGYNYIGDSIVGRATSDFFSPAYIQLAFGTDYKPVDYLSISFSPISGKSTIVSRQYLADAGAFGVEKAVYDMNTGTLIKRGKKIRLEYGGRLTIRFKKDLNKMISWDSYLDIFSNYFHNPQNMDVVFNNLITIKLTKILTISILNQMLYDDDIIIIRDWNKDGKFDHPNDIYGPRVQLMSTLGIGLGLKF